MDSEYDDNALPAVASGLVHSVLTNVNNQIISGELKIDVVKNANSCVESVISSESVNKNASLIENTAANQENESSQIFKPVSSQTTDQIISEIESATRDTSERIDNILHSTNSKIFAETRATPNKSHTINGKRK